MSVYTLEPARIIWRDKRPTLMLVCAATTPEEIAEADSLARLIVELLNKYEEDRAA